MIDFTDQLSKLADNYKASFSEKLRKLDELVYRIHQSPDNIDLLVELRGSLHKVTGSAGTYGFHEVSRASGEWEALVESHLQTLEIDEAAALPTMDSFLRRMREGIRENPLQGSAGEPESAKDGL